MALPATPPPFRCPHCLKENPPFGAGRCQHCKLNMLSLVEQRQREERLPDLWQELDRALEADEKAPSPALKMEIQRLLVEWTPWEKKTETWNDLLAEEREALAEWRQRYQAFQQQWRVHWAILVLLILAPVLAVAVTGQWLAGSLMLLPVLGWAWIGLYEFRRRRAP